MSNTLIAASNVLGTIFFLLAVLWGVFNYREEVAATEFWITYLMAALSGAFFLFLRAMEWGGVAPVLADRIQPIFGLIGITLLGATAIVCALSPIKHQIQ